MHRRLHHASALALALFLVFASPLAASQTQQPLEQQELSRFLHDLPFFLRWARGQGIPFSIYPRPNDLFAPPREQTTRQALERAGWDPERFAFLLCTAGAAATACAPACGRPLGSEERALLERHMPRLLDAFGTGP